jgi:hypothetical protein
LSKKVRKKPTRVSLLRILADTICREHGKPIGMRIHDVATMVSGAAQSRQKSWEWLAKEYYRRYGANAVVDTPKSRRPKVKRTPDRKPGAEFYKCEEWRRLRFRALKASSGACVLCGRSNRATAPPAHGRHITPEMVALLEGQGVMLPPPVEVETMSDMF